MIYADMVLSNIHLVYEYVPVQYTVQYEKKPRLVSIFERNYYRYLVFVIYIHILY